MAPAAEQLRRPTRRRRRRRSSPTGTNTESYANANPRANAGWLWFETPPLARDMRIFGEVQVRLWSTVDRTWITYTPTIVDIDPSQRVLGPGPRCWRSTTQGHYSATRGWLDSRYRSRSATQSFARRRRAVRVDDRREAPGLHVQEGPLHRPERPDRDQRLVVAEGLSGLRAVVCNTVRINWEKGQTTVTLPVVNAPKSPCGPVRRRLVNGSASRLRGRALTSRDTSTSNYVDGCPAAERDDRARPRRRGGALVPRRRLARARRRATSRSSCARTRSATPTRSSTRRSSTGSRPGSSTTATGSGRRSTFPLGDWFTIRVAFAGERAEVCVGDLATPALVSRAEAAAPRAAGSACSSAARTSISASSRFEDEPRSFRHRSRTASAGRRDPRLGGLGRVPGGGRCARRCTGARARGRRSRRAVRPRRPRPRARHRATGRNTVLARTTIRVGAARRHGRSSSASATAPLCSSTAAPLYRGDDTYRSRDYRFLGSIGWYDTLYLPLEEGENELVVAVSEDFGGWGVQARLV